MFDRLKPGYYLLMGFTALQFILIFPIGRADLSTYLSFDGLTRTLIPAWAMFPLVWAFGIAVVMVRRRTDRPLRAMRTILYTNRAWLGRCSILSLLIITFARTLTSYKTLIPKLNPFWADPYLIAADHGIFGTDPWRLTHAIFGPLSTVFFDRVYALWFVVMMLCLGWFCFSRNPKLQLRGLLTSFFSWTLLGIVAATIFSSAGPCYYQNFYGDSRFAPLMANLQATHKDHMLLAINTMDWLIKAYGRDEFGAGISAMPSLHVAIATMCFLACYDYAKVLWLKWVSGLFALSIFIGSVHLGWHYASDGIVGIIAVTLIWWATGRFVDWLDVRDQARLAGPKAKFLPATA